MIGFLQQQQQQQPLVMVIKKGQISRLYINEDSQFTSENSPATVRREQLVSYIYSIFIVRDVH